jgi:hypothetical protein
LCNQFGLTASLIESIKALIHRQYQAALGAYCDTAHSFTGKIPGLRFAAVKIISIQPRAEAVDPVERRSNGIP